MPPATRRGSKPARCSAATRLRIPPTDSQAIRINSDTARFEHSQASQATWSSLPSRKRRKEAACTYIRRPRSPTETLEAPEIPRMGYSVSFQ